MKETSVTPPNRIAWLRDLISLEIVLWDRINARLKAQHDLSLAFFESLYFIGRSPGGSIRVGDLARALRITVGATSKLVDRIDTAGLIRRELDACLVPARGFAPENWTSLPDPFPAWS